MELIALGLAWYLVFLFSIVFHEAAHAWVGLRLGDPTAYHGGQVSLDPVPHIRREPLGTVVVPIISFALGGWMFGWASAPYDYAWARRYPKRSAIMALAGPASNLALFIVAFILIKIGLTTGVFALPTEFDFSSIIEAPQSSLLAVVATLLSVMFCLNLILLLFNLFPLPLFDGRGLLILIAGDRYGRRIMDAFANPTFNIISLIVAWRLFGYIFRPVFTVMLQILY